MNILFTGGNGQLGTELRLLNALGRHNCIFSDVVELSEDLPTLKLDITDSDAVRETVRSNGIELIVNCAAYNNVDKAEDEPQLAMKLNAEAPGILASAAKEAGATLIHVSTDYVFPGTACAPIAETVQPAPGNAYGRSKLAGEEAVRASGCNYIIIRTAWLYSPFGKNFVKTMLRLTAEKESLNVVADQVGSPTSAADLAEAIMQIINGGLRGTGATYHFTGEGAVSWYDFACAVRELSKHRRCEIRPCSSLEFPSRAARPHYSVLDKSLIKKTYGITIPWWYDSLKKCLDRII